MKKAIVTGAGGTVGQALVSLLSRQGISVAKWDRRKYAVLDEAKTGDFVEKTGPDIIFHLAIASRPTGMENEGNKVNVQWPRQLAALAAAKDIRFVFSSSVMVYSESVNGPYDPQSSATVDDGYGLDKKKAEAAVQEVYPRAHIARLGWQIGSAPGSNNMVDYLFSERDDNGAVSASRKWLPACAFLHSTADALIRLSKMEPDVYLLDSNTRWSFFQVLNALNRRHGRPARIIADDSFVYDQRMHDPRIPMAPLEEHLPELLER